MIRQTRDLLYRLRHGPAAPQSYERIWVKPADVARRFDKSRPGAPKLRRRDSGRLFGGDWDLGLPPLGTAPKIAACTRHFRDGAPWEESGIYDYMARQIAKRGGAFDSCRTAEDVRRRYAEMDRLFEAIRRDGLLSFARDSGGRPREKGGIFIHIDRDGQPVFGAIGNHRMAMAKLLGLREIPAQLGVIHPDAFAAGALDRYRRPAAARAPVSPTPEPVR